VNDARLLLLTDMQILCTLARLGGNAQKAEQETRHLNRVTTKGHALFTTNQIIYRYNLTYALCTTTIFHSCKLLATPA
jgi:hypothetical protein